MIITEWVEAKWNAKTKKRYEDLGYKYTKMGDSFSIRVKDVSPWNSSIIEVKCDYCGNKFSSTLTRRTAIMRQSASGSKKDACSRKECISEKIIESNNKLYNSDSFIGSETGRKKISESVMNKYGVSNVFQIEDVKDKIKATNIDRYGVESYTQTEEYRIKSKNTSLERYGTEYPSQSEEIKAKYIPKITGENHYNWKGGISPENNLIRMSREMLKWRKDVYNRDFYTCQKCLAKGGKLNAHHIMNFADFPELRTNLDNGTTFCEECHIQFHRVYGKNNTNREQLNEFLKSHG